MLISLSTVMVIVFRTEIHIKKPPTRALTGSPPGVQGVVAAGGVSSPPPMVGSSQAEPGGVLLALLGLGTEPAGRT